MIEEANKYYEAGLSVIPIGDKKLPIGSWKRNQEATVKPDNVFNTDNPNFKGIGVVCGKVSGNVECIDIDTKYDLTGTLFEDFKAVINEQDPTLLKKMVVQSTPSGGYHFIYKCKELSGNLKLANRHTTNEERKLKPKEKAKVLLETRGEGGYFMCAPSIGYKVLYGKLEKLQEITPLERKTIMACAKLFNEVFKEPHIRKEQKEIMAQNVSPFEDYNERGDVLQLLEKHGWKLTHQKGSRCLMLRPGGTGKWSADWHEDKRLFYVFSTSTEFDSEKGYNPSQVFTTLEHNGDYSAAASWLLKNGFGAYIPEKQNGFTKTAAASKISIDDNDFSFLAKKEDTDDYIVRKRNGTFKLGDRTGFEELDKYFRFKPAQLDMVLGHDNTGKSVVSWYLATLNALLHDRRYLVFAGENVIGGVKCRLLEFYLCKKVEKMTETELARATAWVEDHFTLIRNDEAFTYRDMINIGKKMLRVRKYDNFIIEPYNMLVKTSENDHQYDTNAMIDFRIFIRQTGIGIILNVHAATNALRKVYPREHELAGYVTPPNKADTEGGGKFPGKADNFIVVHRMTNHETEWMWNELHIQKIKESETGGKPSFRDKPFKLKMHEDGVGFVDEWDFNPVLDYHRKNVPVQQEINLQPNDDATQKPQKGIETLEKSGETRLTFEDQ